MCLMMRLCWVYGHYVVRRGCFKHFIYSVVVKAAGDKMSVGVGGENMKVRPTKIFS